MDAVIDIAQGLAAIAGVLVGLVWLVCWVNLLTAPFFDPPGGWYGVFLFAPLVVILVVAAWCIGSSF